MWRGHIDRLVSTGLSQRTIEHALTTPQVLRVLDHLTTHCIDRFYVNTSRHGKVISSIGNLTFFINLEDAYTFTGLSCLFPFPYERVYQKIGQCGKAVSIDR